MHWAVPDETRAAALWRYIRSQKLPALWYGGRNLKKKQPSISSSEIALELKRPPSSRPASFGLGLGNFWREAWPARKALAAEALGATGVEETAVARLRSLAEWSKRMFFFDRTGRWRPYEGEYEDNRVVFRVGDNRCRWRPHEDTEIVVGPRPALAEEALAEELQRLSIHAEEPSEENPDDGVED